jgi:hypothetical protein
MEICIGADNRPELRQPVAPASLDPSKAFVILLVTQSEEFVQNLFLAGEIIVERGLGDVEPLGERRWSSGMASTPAVIRTVPPTKVRRKASLRARIRSAVGMAVLCPQ